jgi:hypothetical protein
MTHMQIVFGLVCLVGIAGFVIGWFMNIMDLINLATAPALYESVLMVCLRVLGIFVAPLGGILGWF